MSRSIEDVVPIVLCVIVFSVFLWYEVKSHIAEFQQAKKEAPNAVETK